jgi:hypothetical protein
MVVNAAIGIAAFYTTPRYTADDYRPLIRQMVQQGSPADTLLAIFPWQVGYWRAYTEPLRGEFGGAPVTPTPLLLGDGAVTWSPQVASTIDQALRRGVLWFPAPLTFGSTLPPAIEEHLQTQALNLQNHWYAATRLTAWANLPAPPAIPVNADFGSVRLAAAGAAPQAAASANTPVAATLVWEGKGLDAANISLRIQDDAGHVWSSREYEQALPPPGQTLTTTAGLIVPLGLPPGGYQLAVSVQTPAGQPLTLAGSDAVAAVIGDLEITLPDLGTAGETGSAAAGQMNRARLPIAHPLARPAESGGLQLLGYSGPAADEQLLAGTELGLTLFLANTTGDPPPRDIYVSLLDAAGAGVAGYEGWPLAGYPTAAWPAGALVQVPAAFHLPGALSSGTYRLVGGFRTPPAGEKSPPVELAQLTIVQRPASFTRPAPAHAFDPAPQLGTHVRLLGYDLIPSADGQTQVQLFWEVLQPLLPAHHIFVHLDAPDGQTVAQADGPPVADAAPDDWPAPTGSWQPGEFLTTTHVLDAAVGPGEVIRVGLYDPHTQVRLPVTVDGQAAGDSVELR